jgi:DNA-binding XRE family transcriptional regulator
MKAIKDESLKSLDQFIDEQYGERGASKREIFEKGYEEFKIGVLLQQARLEKGMTQEELAEKCGTNKGYISKVENNIKDVRISTLRRIVEVGLGGHLNLSINL